MNPDVVVDVGNTRIKWGRCWSNGLLIGCAVPPDDADAWGAQAEKFDLPKPAAWVVTGVHPARRDRLIDWLRRRGDRVRLLDEPTELPLRILLDEPRKAGIDRLFNAVAANHFRAPDEPAVVVSAGTAVTVDFVDATGAFRGGAILPGFRLMARALHEHTALLPLVETWGLDLPVEAPGTSTVAAIKAGVFWAVAGGVRALIEKYAEAASPPPARFFTGGDGYAVWGVLGGMYSGELTLHGIRLSAEALP